MKSTLYALQMAASVWVAIGLSLLAIVWTSVFFLGFIYDRLTSLRLRLRFKRTRTLK